MIFLDSLVKCFHHCMKIADIFNVYLIADTDKEKYQLSNRRKNVWTALQTTRILSFQTFVFSLLLILVNDMRISGSVISLDWLILLASNTDHSRRIKVVTFFFLLLLFFFWYVDFNRCTCEKNYFQVLEQTDCYLFGISASCAISERIRRQSSIRFAWKKFERFLPLICQRALLLQTDASMSLFYFPFFVSHSTSRIYIYIRDQCRCKSKLERLVTRRNSLSFIILLPSLSYFYLIAYSFSLHYFHFIRSVSSNDDALD